MAPVQAMVVEGAAGSMHLREVPDPQPDSGQVVAEVQVAGVNPVDVGNRSDSTWAGVISPYVVGYEFAGVVTENPGAGGGLRVGEPVWGLLPVRGTRWGAYAERVAVDADHVAPRPVSLDPIAAGVLPLAGATAIQILNRLALPAGAWVLVLGASGGVGHLLLQVAAARGIRVAAVARPAARQRVLDLGAELWIDRFAPSPAAVAVAELGHHLDGVVDLAGRQLNDSLPHLRENGQAAAIVDLRGDYEEAIDRNVSIHGVLVRPGREVLQALTSAVDQGLRPLVAATYPLHAAEAAHQQLVLCL